MFIDTHAHIYLDEFKNDIEEVIIKAKENGVSKILLPNIDKDSIKDLKNLCSSYPDFVLPMMGLHPCSVKKDNYIEQLELIRNELYNDKYIAVGEIGIDMYWDKSTLNLQEDAFATQIEWAFDLDLPIVIHARDSFYEIFDVLNKFDHKKLKGVFHCFTGGLDEMNHILKTYPNFYLGLGGVSTFKNSGMDKVIPSIPLEKILLETDAPYLSPVPNRGKRNEPSYLIYTAQKVSDLKEISLDRLSQICAQNTINVFGNL